MISIEVCQVPHSGRSWQGRIDSISAQSFAVAFFAAIVEGVDFRKDCEIVVHSASGPVFASSDFKEEFKAAIQACKDRWN